MSEYNSLGMFFHKGESVERTFAKMFFPVITGGLILFGIWSKLNDLPALREQLQPQTCTCSEYNEMPCNYGIKNRIRNYNKDKCLESRSQR